MIKKRFVSEKNFVLKHKAFLLFVSSVLIYFFSWFFVYKIGLNSLTIQSEDTLPTLFLPVTILKEGTLYADTYYQMILHSYPQPDDKDFTKGSVPFYYKKVGSHYITAFPIMSGLLAIPIFIFPVLLQIPITLDNMALWGHLSAAILTSISGVVLYKLLKQSFFEGDDYKSILLTTVYLFATINLSMISQALWQYSTLELMLILGLLYFYKTQTNKNLLLSGLFFSFAVLTRPTSILVFIIMAVLLFVKYKSTIKIALFSVGMVISSIFLFCLQ